MARKPSKVWRSANNVITASARLVDITKEKIGVSRVDSWQSEAYDYYDLVGELKFACSFTGNVLSRSRLIPAVLDDRGKISTAFNGDGEPILDIVLDVQEEIRSLKSLIGGQSEIMRLLGVNLFLAGEAILLGHTNDDGMEQWEVLSTQEVKLEGGKVQRKSSYGNNWSVVSGAMPIRIWKPHPRCVQAADSQIRSLLEVLEELVILTRAVRGIAVSRMSAGLMLVPEEWSYAVDPDSPHPTESEDPFVFDLMTALTTPISDKSSASSVVPFVMRVPFELRDGFKYIDFSKNFKDFPAQVLRDEAVIRLARGLDLPVEVVMGHAQTTFANAFQIDEDLFKSHIEPLLELIVDALTVGYLYPKLLARGFSQEEIEQVRIHFDASELISHPNQSQNAKDVYAAGELSGQALRSYTGFAEGDAPTGDMVAPPVIATTDRIAAAVEVTIENAIEKMGRRLRAAIRNHETLSNSLRMVPLRELAMTMGPSKVQSLVSEKEIFGNEFAPAVRLIGKWIVQEERTPADSSDMEHEIAAAARSALYGETYTLNWSNFYASER